MPTMAIAVPTGQAARDMLHSGVLKRLTSAAGTRVLVLTPAHQDQQLRVDLRQAGAEVAPLEPYRPTLAERCLRSAQLATLRTKSHTIQGRLRSGKGMRTLLPLVATAEMLVGPQRVRQALNRLIVRAGRPNGGSALRSIRPDLVVVTRVFNWSADYGLLKEAHALGIPAVAVVSSWDNLTSKGFFPCGVREIVVWNEVMRQEAIELFDFPEQHIHVCGIPRYDGFFRRQHLRDRQAFCREAGLDPQRRILAFTTANTGLIRHPANPHPEVDVIRFLADAAQRGLLGEPAQLLVRVHPLAEPGVFAPLARLPGVHLQLPGRSSPFRDRLLTASEDRLLGETLWHSDVVINHASTITIDAAVFDTPVVCVGFDWLPDQPWIGSVRALYQQDHYQKLSTTGGFHLATSRHDLLACVRRYLQDPSQDRRGRAAIVRQQCQYDDGRSAERVAARLLSALHDHCEPDGLGQSQSGLPGSARGRPELTVPLGKG